jgi:type IV pilus assembly protein PilE
MKYHASAFTLLELIIALAIGAILMVYAVPSYRSHVARVRTGSTRRRRSIARPQFIEAGAPGEVSSLPTGLDQAPPFGTPVYGLRALPADEANGGYAVEARPLEAGPMRDDPCGTFILDATGLRTNRTADGAAGRDSDMCWNTR